MLFSESRWTDDEEEDEPVEEYRYRGQWSIDHLKKGITWFVSQPVVAHIFRRRISCQRIHSRTRFHHGIYEESELIWFTMTAISLGLKRTLVAVWVKSFEIYQIFHVNVNRHWSQLSLTMHKLKKTTVPLILNITFLGRRNCVTQKSWHGREWFRVGLKRTK